MVGFQSLLKAVTYDATIRVPPENSSSISPEAIYLLVIQQQQNRSQMENNRETWENTQTRNHKPSKTYGLNTSNPISHLVIHDVRSNEQGLNDPPQIFVTMATYDCEFVLLQNQFATGKMVSDPEFKELLKFKTNYPIMQCQLQNHLNNANYKNCLIGYLIDMYSNVYTVNFTRNIELSTKFAIHPVQFTSVYRNTFNVNIDKLYLQTPLMLKKISDGIISVNLKGEIQFIDVNQSKSWISSYDDHLNAHKLQLGHLVLAAAHNTYRCKYDNIIVIASHNMKAPYVFVNCTSLSDFQNQKAFQDKYQWMQDSVQITYCSIDTKTSTVVTCTVTQNIEIFQITSINSNYYLKKKFGFFMGMNLNLNDFNIDFNIQSIHANRGLLMVVSCKQYLIFDIQKRMICKRSKGTSISMLRHGGVIDRNENLISMLIVKGYNHINQAQSKMGKPNLHFKTIDYTKKDKS